ncbi:MAG: serine hydrolase [Clostridia bacterium]|nr:serine hydrolase [Clostridia bacterium]
MKKKEIIILIAFLVLFAIVLSLSSFNVSNKVTIAKIDNMITGTWQAEVKFPDWKGYIDDTLAMNSMYSFDGVEDQGKLYFTVAEKVESFDLFVNNIKVNTNNILNGIYEVDISKIAVNGTNTIQVSNITPTDLKEAITVNIPYPRVITGTLKEVGLSEEPFKLISEIIESDIDNGFSSAQLAVIKDGKLVYQNAWGQTNSYNKDGTKIENGTKVTNDTLYDLASNTKMYSVAYAIQYLMDQEKISLDDKIVDILGPEFANNTIEVVFASYGENYPGLEKIKEWKSGLTIKNVMMHQAGFPDSGHYHNQKFDAVNQKLDLNVDNVLYIENANKEKTLKEGIYKTPLLYEPGTKTLYSDIDYMLLGMIIEKITGKDLNTFLSETFWEPMGLQNITYRPLDNGFKKDDCAATELNGNTRDGLVDFPNVRKDTVQGEVHDEECYYTMEGVSGHAGLFANATDLAKLASVMLTGGYGNNKYFSKNIRDILIAPQSSSNVNYGIGWWREADDKRVWYFGTQSPESTVGHQGWTGTLTMIDFENNMVIVFLTNSINTAISDKSGIETANSFNGNFYTTSTLGFVPQIIYTGFNNDGNNLKDALDSLIKDMSNEKQKYIENKEEKNGKKFDENHAVIKAKKALDEVVTKRKTMNY